MRDQVEKKEPKRQRTKLYKAQYKKKKIRKEIKEKIIKIMLTQA